MEPIPIQRTRREKYPTDGKVLTVTRPGKHGNPFVACGDGMLGYWIENDQSMIVGFADTRKEAVELAVKLFRQHLASMKFYQPAIFAALIQKVQQAKYVACWCPLDSPCHRDVWIELAAAAPADEVKP